MKKVLFLLIAATLMLVSWTKTVNVKYTTAQNYFVRNDSPEWHIIKATSQAQMDSAFGMAAAMGKAGRPTSINFAKKFAVAISLPETDVRTQIHPISLVKTGKNELTLTYSVKREGKTSYTTKPMFIILVNKKYAGYKIIDREVRNL